MNELWSLDGSAVKVWGDYSPHPVVIEKVVVEHYGGTDAAFHAFHRLRRAGMLPRPDVNESYPFSILDITLAEENSARGERYWRYGTLYPSVHEYVKGYFHLEGHTAIFYGGTRVKLRPETVAALNGSAPLLN